MMKRNQVFVALAAILSGLSWQPDGLAQERPARIDIVHTEVLVVVTPGEDVATVEQRLVFQVSSSGSDIHFDTGDLQILCVWLNGKRVTFSENSQDKPNASGLRITPTAPLVEGGEQVLEFLLKAPLKRGFANRPDLTASAYFACDWMVCNQEDFADRFTGVLTLDVPASMETIGPGRKVSVSEASDGRTRHLWRSAEAFPAYVYSFAVGNLETITLDSSCETELILLAPEITDDLREAFSPTCAMLSFFESKAGVSLPEVSYSQLYIPDSRAAQEAISHSLIGGTFLDPILEDPQEDWVIAHELAHQWWGNRITAAGLSEFWLNEGIVTFMVAAWKEDRWGRAAYEREIALNRSRWQRGIEKSGNVPLSFSGPYSSTGARFTIQYSKGAVFLHELREFVGDEAFWAGLAEFTREGFGKAVTSNDFERAMQGHTDKPLGPIFADWVY